MTNYTKTIEANDAIGFFVSGKDGNFYVQRVIRPAPDRRSPDRRQRTTAFSHRSERKKLPGGLAGELL